MIYEKIIPIIITAANNGRNNKNTIADHWVSLIKVTHDKSTLVLSGFYNEDIPYLENLASRNGLIPLYSNSENNWAVLVLKYN